MAVDHGEGGTPLGMAIGLCHLGLNDQAVPVLHRIRPVSAHCGAQPKWQIGLANLQNKTGSNAPLKKFRLNLRQIIEDDCTPFYKIEMMADDLVIFRPRSASAARSGAATP